MFKSRYESDNIKSKTYICVIYDEKKLKIKHHSIRPEILKILKAMITAKEYCECRFYIPYYEEDGHNRTHFSNLNLDNKVFKSADTFIRTLKRRAVDWVF